MLNLISILPGSHSLTASPLSPPQWKDNTGVIASLFGGAWSLLLLPSLPRLPLWSSGHAGPKPGRLGQCHRCRQ
jgi:hypothetical protein